MGIHYDYKSTRGDKAMKKEAKRKARIEQRRPRRSSANPKESDQKILQRLVTAKSDRSTGHGTESATKACKFIDFPGVLIHHQIREDFDRS